MNSLFKAFKVSYSFRRELIDQALAEFAAQFKGNILDLGGKKTNKRGTFAPPSHLSWTYLNLNPHEGVDVVANGEALPMRSSAFDWVVCIEVLEFVQNPDQLASEIYHVLKSGGRLFLTTPFLYRIHTRPHDRQRFTDQKLKELLFHFKINIIKPQGYFFTVMADFMKSAVAQVRFVGLRYLVALLFLPIILLLRFIDQFQCVRESDFFTSFTTGYFVIAEKK